MNQEYPPITLSEIDDILGQTIKGDHINRQIIFLSMVLTYTEQDQVNIILSGQSSSGKTFLAEEVSSLFPTESVIKLAHTSPTAFFHNSKEMVKKGNEFYLDMRGKTYIFLDQPHSQLLQFLRPVLSHDQKVIECRITDKDQKFGLRTKTVKIVGSPTVIFCSANFEIDEQELTRSFSLSPEVNQEKLTISVKAAIHRESNTLSVNKEIYQNKSRIELTERIIAIREANIKHIIVPQEEYIFTKFADGKKLIPRNHRDIVRVIRLAKAIALINLWHRNYNPENQSISVETSDIDEAFGIWKQIAEYQQVGISQQTTQIFTRVIAPLCKNNIFDNWATKQSIIHKYLSVFGSPLSTYQLNRYILPSLESAGLIFLEFKPGSKKEYVVKLA